MKDVPTCCIFVPIYKTVFTYLEIAALNRCIEVLSEYHFVFGLKKSIDHKEALRSWESQLNDISWSVHSLDDYWLSSVSSYNALMLSVEFYISLSTWDYMLVFQLDAWIIEGNLSHWLLKGYSYVGAPWCPELGDDSECPTYSGVGNGGLSLRKVCHMIDLLSSPLFDKAPVFSRDETMNAAKRENIIRVGRLDMQRENVLSIIESGKLLIKSIVTATGLRNNLGYYRRIGTHEDIIIGYMAPRIYDWLILPPINEAAHFSIETNPYEVFYLYGMRRPFGCHGWEKGKNKAFFVSQFKDAFGSIPELHYPDLNSTGGEHCQI